ncbi:hypothetical protein [Planococcus sp. ISL-109]|uniref:hypothetical protein n=1 Tax=Planococcus sp. ISL-109 TaxID=2819166 RepID=UPI001BE646D4|nr:hypothetical protein [Planococcus sp. ISL-109]MBT2584243.1 hypothetical protein [Planococcus sp. ISL-109]
MKTKIICAAKKSTRKSMAKGKNQPGNEQQKPQPSHLAAVLLLDMQKGRAVISAWKCDAGFLGHHEWIRRLALGRPLAVSQENRLSHCIGSP